MLGEKIMIALLVQYLAASLVFAIDGVYPKSLYWLGAAIITTAVLWMK